MTVNDPGDPLLPPPRERGSRLSARARHRRARRRGCVRFLAFSLVGLFALVLILVVGGYWYLGTSNFAELVRLRIETTLEGRLGREVTIGKVTIVRSRPQKVILDDVRIANAPGGVAKNFAIVRQVEITGGVESFRSRRVRVGRVDIRDPQVWFEIFPDGTHNFPKWKSGPKSPREILRIDIGSLFVTNGLFGFLDRKHDIEATAHRITSRVDVTRAEGLYEGIMTSTQMRVRLQDFLPFDVAMRGGFRYTPGTLALRSVALEGKGIRTYLSGSIDPLTEAAYDLRLTSQLDLDRVREIFGVENTLEGTLALDGRLRGRAGDFELAGDWTSPLLTADAYELAEARGHLAVTNGNATVDVESARYGGGTVGAHYVLSQFAEPYPMRVDLRYDGISLEQLFADWGVEGTGLRGAATGSLAYGWNKEKILEGAGEGTARLARSTTAFSGARYPVPLAGSANFGIDRGVVTFRRAELDTPQSHVSLTGTLKIEDIVTNLRMAIQSRDLSELDRIAYNFAHSAGKDDYELLGLGGVGTITGTVSGPIERPQVVAAIEASRTQYNNVLLGASNIDLRYDGNRSLLTFDRAVFNHGGGRLELTGTVAFPERGPAPVFDIAMSAEGYPAQRAIDAIGLDFQIGEGLATGRMVVAGTPDSGRATFDDLTIRRADAVLALDGSVEWLPGEGNTVFDLAIAATNFPVTDIATFLDFADIPLTGQLTGTLQLAGRKEALEGSGSVTIREGAIMGEPVEFASADITFTQGRMRATDVLVRAAAGEIRGEAEVDLTNERFSYTIASGSLDVSRIEILSALNDLLGGKLVINSTGAGTFEQPELIVEARLEGATLEGLTLPADAPPPSLYLEIRNGRMIVRGSIADIVTIEGDGIVGENLAVEGTVRVTIADVARAMAIATTTSTIPAAGNVVIDLRLSGQLSPIEQLVVEATAPVFNLRVGDHELVAPEPLRVVLRNGRLEFESFTLRRPDSGFTITGFAEVTGSKQLGIDIRGQIAAALLQLFMPDIRAEGQLDVAVAVRGVVAEPSIEGTAELRDAEVKFAGFPQLIDEINGRLRFRGDRIDIESLRATIGGGTVVAGGFVNVDGLQPQNVRITLQGSDVALRYYEGLTVEANFTLLLTGDLERAVLQGDVDVTRALYYRDFDVQQTLLDVLLARNRIAPVSAATWQDRISLRINLNAPETLAINNNIAELTGSADLEVTGTVAAPVILGEVTLDEGGTVRIQGVDYTVTRGTIGFQNPFRIDPFLDVTVEGTVSGFGASETEGGPYEVTVNVTGTLDRLTPTITSDPPASDITLFSILGLGGLGGTPGERVGAGALGQSLLYSSLSSLIGSRVFPFVDSFAYDPGTLDTATGPGAKVTFEKRLSNDIRFLLVYNLENQQSRQVVEWLVNPTWTLQLTRDEADEYRIDARFRRRYDAHWRWGGDEEPEIANAAVMAADGETATAAVLPRLPAVTDVNVDAADGALITQIDFRGDAGFDAEAAAREVTLAPGEPVTIRGLQASIRNLFATGNFRDVRVDATEVDGGVALTFALYLQYRIGEIAIEGIEGDVRGRARRELTIRAGEILSLDAVDDSASAAEEALEQSGYLEAEVNPETSFDRARNVADVRFFVEPGPQAVIGSIILEGDHTPFTESELIGELERTAGETFHLGESREGAERMLNFMVRRDHRRADVDYLGHVYDDATNRVALRYRVEAGPLVRVAVAGVPQSMVRRWLPFDRNQQYSEDVIERAADTITEELQRRGYYLATVDTEAALEDDVWTTTFHVDPGERYRLVEVQFRGNDQVDDDALHDVIQTTARGGFRRVLQSLFRRHSGPTREQLSDDRDSIEAFYQLEGFSSVVVSDPVVKTAADGTLTVEFPIEEGPQTLVASLAVEGNEQFDADALPARKLSEGEALNPQLLQDDIVALQTFYAQRGHVEVQVTPRVELSDDRKRATVTYVIAEGPQVNVDDIVVRGNTYTDRDVILRKSGLEPGRPFSYTSLLEAQRELYRLGIFQRVEVQGRQAGTAVSDRDVAIRVEEGRNLTLTGSVGIRAERGQQDSGMQVNERIAVAAAHRNLFGTGRYLGLEGVFSRNEQEAFLTYREPFVSRWNVPVQFQIFQSDDSTRAGTQILQRGASIEAAKVALLQTRWSLRYEYKISECRSGDLCTTIDEGLPVEDLDRSLLNIQISSITPTFFWDTRDDILDPHRGFFASASVEYAFPFISADAHFLKEYVQGAVYLPVTDRTVVALSARFGMIQAYARDSVTNNLLPIALSERFTAGGETTHRGFGLDRLGDLCLTDPDLGPENGLQPIPGCKPTLWTDPKGIDREEMTIGRVLPLGGRALSLINAEYRFPLFATVGGAVFADIGNVYADGDIDFSDLRYGTGVGVRYLSPVGPLRLDVAVPLNRRWWEDGIQYFLTLGYAF